MKLTIDDGCHATVTDDPLRLVPRFDFRDFRVRIAKYANVEERQRFLRDAFGSEPWLWDTPEQLRFDQHNRELSGAELQLPDEAADPEDSARVLTTPAVRPGGLRADEARDFHLEVSADPGVAADSGRTGRTPGPATASSAPGRPVRRGFEGRSGPPGGSGRWRGI